MSLPQLRPRRSCLYAPGANAKALAKARELAADVLLFDLEDAVAPEAKIEARGAVIGALKGGGFGRKEALARINALSTPWGGDDIAGLAEAAPAGLLAPKVNSGEDVLALDELMSEAGYAPSCALWVMIETPLALLNIKEIAAASKRTRLAAFVMGTNDLAKDLRARQTGDRAAFQFALSVTVAAARAYGLVAVDGVYNDIPNTEGFIDVCRQGVTLGFDGKTLIHPSQIEPCNALFAPSAAEVEEARAVIAAFAASENAGKGVLKVNGKMTELLHLDEAKRLVAVSEMIEGAA